MTKITIDVSGAGAETKIEEPGVTTQALTSPGTGPMAGALNAGSAPSLADATAGAFPLMGNVEDMGVGGIGEPIAAGPPPERLFGISEGGDQ